MAVSTYRRQVSIVARSSRNDDGQRDWWERSVLCGTLVWAGRPGHPAIHSGVPPVRVENAWPAIIDPDTFVAVQNKMASRRPAQIHPRTLPSHYLLSGFLFCYCGHAMIGRSAKSHQY
jgi:site-specific DNA recombinase